MKTKKKRRKIKFSIQNKLFLVISIILLANILVVLFFGNTFLEKYYVYHKKMEIQTYGDRIKQAYLHGTDSEMDSALKTCALNNVTAIFFDRVTGQIIYSFGQQQQDYDKKLNVRSWTEKLFNDDILMKLDAGGSVIEISNQSSENSIFLYTKLQQGTYLLLETPMAYIESTAQTAVQFFVLLLMITLLFGLIVTYFVARHIAEPIREIEQTAKQIARFDFKKRCTTYTNDEIASLAHSVNQMADALEEHIFILKKKLKQEEKQNQAQKEFLSNVSHDFKTPLSLITAYCEAIQDGAYENIEEVSNILIEQSEKMNHLVNDLLTLQQLESGAVPFKLTPFSINDAIYSVLQEYRIFLGQKNLQFLFCPTEEYIVEADYTSIKRVLSNLCENAVKYVDEKKQLEIWIEKSTDRQICIYIYNSYPPFSHQTQKNVFQMFFKEDKSRSQKDSYGIGLSIVKSIMQLHKQPYGTKNVKEGVAFWFSLLLYEEDASSGNEDSDR